MTEEQYDTLIVEEEIKVFKTLSSEMLLVSVPKEVFAAEPPAWEKTWVNHYYSERPFDQCEYRGRRLYSYTIKPILFALEIFVRVLVLLFGVLCGARGSNIKYIIHPIMYTFTNTIDGIFENGIIFIGNAKIQNTDESLNIKNIITNYGRIIFMPMLWVVIILLHKAHCLLGFIAVISVIVSLFLIFFGGMFFTHSFHYKNENQAAWYLDKSEEEMIICNPNRKITSLQDLPKQKKTIKLRFLDFKSKVCRPFSR